jgi:transcriptional regulator with XRE-family HTH domain
MTPQQLHDWMIRNGLSKADVFRRTGIARTTLDRYLAGTYPIPKLVRLACAAIDAGIDVED